MYIHYTKFFREMNEIRKYLNIIKNCCLLIILIKKALMIIYHID